MTLGNGLVRLEFDDRNGSLAQITDLGTGTRYLTDPSEARLLRVFAPDPERWIDRYADSHQSGRPEMELRGDTLEICFRDLVTPEGSASGIAALVKVRLPQGESEATFALELQNRGAHIACEVVFPWIGGWHGYPGSRGTIQVGTHGPLDPFTSLRRNDGWNIMDFTRKTTIGFPHVNIPMCDVSNGTVGLSYNFYPVDRDLNYDLFVTDLNERLGDPHPSFGWVHRPFIPPGGRWRSGPVGLAPHQGDWHAAAERMRTWLAGWWKAPVIRPELRGSIGFHNVMCRDFTGRHLRRVSELPRIARHGLAHGLGHMIVWDMPLLGMYLRAGSGGMFEDSPERITALRQALTEVSSAGVTASPLINLRLGMQAHPFWKTHGERWAIRSMFGAPAQETLPLRKNTALLINRSLDQGGSRFCQADPEFQAWALDCTRRVLDLGFEAIFIDQPFSEDYCFSDRHGHRPGAPGHEGVCRWIPEAARIVHAHDPRSYVIGEVPDIWNTQYFDLWWFWDWSWLSPEIFRTILPDSLQSWVIDAFDHEDQVGKAFAQGFLLNLNVRSLEQTLEDAPAFAARISALAALRQKTYGCTLAGRFMDRAGLGVETDAQVAAAVYDAGGTPGIILGEGSRAAAGGGTVKLTLDSERWPVRGVEEAVLHRQDGSSATLPARRSGDTLVLETRLARWECAVVELRGAVHGAALQPCYTAGGSAGR
jgi:hypothetical protein